MPELPEVQTTVNGLNRYICNLTINDVWTDYNSKFHRGKDSIKDPLYFEHFKNEILGAKILRVRRVAKNILIEISRKNKLSTILIHMKMTGHLMIGNFNHDKKTNRWTPAQGERASLSDPYNRFIHLAFTFSNGKQLVLSDTRKFAKITLIPDEHLGHTVHLEDIGPDPLDKTFTLETFVSRLNMKARGRIKQTLMDQTVMAGVGNIYSDEALWRAGIHPEERVMNIPKVKLGTLHTALLQVLKKGIDFGGDSMSDYRNIHGERGKFQEHHNVYQKKNELCSKPKCGGTIIRKVIAGRSAHFCNKHQKLSTD